MDQMTLNGSYTFNFDEIYGGLILPITINREHSFNILANYRIEDSYSINSNINYSITNHSFNKFNNLTYSIGVSYKLFGDFL